jgi:di/tricarboxylate transporter
VSIEITLVLLILGATVFFLIFEWVPMEVVALFSLGAVAVTGLVSPKEALSGFSSPAVVTVWAVFIVSGGLTRTGVANILGRILIRVGGRHEAVIVAVLMLSAGVLSAFMNNVAVAAMMLPVVMDITRQTGHFAPRLLMPLAYGSLLGGLTTLIGTPPNILVSDALRQFGMKPFTFFDFTPVGLGVFLAGTAYVVLIGRHLLPKRNVAGETLPLGHLDLREAYDLRQGMFLLRVPARSPLVGKNLMQSRLGSALGLHVIGILRDSRIELAPAPSAVLQAMDRLLVEGKLERMDEIRSLRELDIQKEASGKTLLFKEGTGVREVQLKRGSAFEGRSIGEIGIRNLYGLNVLAMRRGDTITWSGLKDIRLERSDILLVHGAVRKIDALGETNEFEKLEIPGENQLDEMYRLDDMLFVVRVPENSPLLDKYLSETRLDDALDMRVLCITREDVSFLPEPETRLLAGDRLLLEGKRDDYMTLGGLEELEIDQGTLPEMSKLESARVGLIEAILSPRTVLAGKSLRQLNFRKKYGISVLAVWREGKVIRSNIRDIPLRFGDALLLYGPRDRLNMLGRELDFMVLTQEAQEPPRSEKAGLSILIMAAVIFPVIMGWVPIYISAVIGAAMMVATGCLKMDEAYRFIEWKAVFVIAGMLPLGMALEKTGAAKLLAEGVVSMVDPLGPTAVLLGLMVLTFAATCFVPTAALVVLMAPIALGTATDMGLSPYALFMGIAMAASASFMTPVSHPANILVMGPGGYRFIDYVKVGSTLTLVVLLTLLVLLPRFWPLFP